MIAWSLSKAKMIIDKEIIEDDTKATLEGNNEVLCYIAEPPD